MRQGRWRANRMIVSLSTHLLVTLCASCYPIGPLWEFARESPFEEAGPAI
ncbi:hypothetical protein GCM10007874_10650 [Labrys miyagiensis]|uniref:Uncharacterized protein n=1 Tax=Labrys miyagiensis TaxID=346912 RepID=A0ABQ6CE34_9HYPH|nr:hypothetical protein GCM10007874_10650 [Labrys miyagiensis]